MSSLGSRSAPKHLPCPCVSALQSFEMDLPLSLRRVAAEGLGLEGLPEVEEEVEEGDAPKEQGRYSLCSLVAIHVKGLSGRGARGGDGDVSREQGEMLCSRSGCWPANLTNTADTHESHAR